MIRPRPAPAAALPAFPLLALALSLLTLPLLAAFPDLVAAQEPEEAERLYGQQRYKEAYEAFRARMEEDGPRPELQYNAGNALYRLGRVAEAITAFRQALEGAPDVQERGLYNMGTAYARQAEIKEYKYEDLRSAVRAYEDALALDPGDQDAKWNLELLLRKLSLPGYGPRTMGTRGGESWRGGNLTKAGYSGSQTGYGAATGGGYGSSQGESVRRMTESQARQLLQTVRREQGRQGGASTNEDRAPPPSRGKPDW